MNLHAMQQRKQEMGYSLATLSSLTGVPLGTLQKIFSGQTQRPRQTTLEKLAAVLQPTPAGTMRVAERAPAYNAGGIDPQRQGSYTIKDYFALPEDRRYELIDGVIYEMASPSRQHQVIAGALFSQLLRCVEEHGPADCYPYIAPLDVQLDRDNKTVVQPDVMLCCESEQQSGTRIFGAPAFIAEVLSPSSHQRDIFLKLHKYKNAGVKEYWVIYPERQKVVVYLLAQDDDVAVYTFDDTIPLTLSEGRCISSLTSIKGRLS